MDDNRCVVIEFVNEENEIGVGYRDWLLPKQLTDAELQEKIDCEEEIKTIWPNCEIGPSNKMKKRLLGCEWEEYVVKVMAFGKWTEMCDVRKNIEKYGVCNVSRDSRRGRTKRKLNSDSESGKSDDNTEPSKTKEKKNSKQLKWLDDLKQKKLKKDFAAKSGTMRKKPKIADESQDSDSDSQLMYSDKPTLIKKISMLQREVEELKIANKVLVSTTDAYKDLLEMKQLITDLIETLQDVKQCSGNTIPNQSQKEDKSSKVALKKGTFLPCSAKDDDNEAIIPNFRESRTIHTHDNGVIDQEQKLKGIVESSRHHATTSSVNNGTNDINDKLFPCSDSAKTTQIKEKKDTSSAGEDEEFSICKKQLSKCRHSNSIVLTGDLMNVLFTRDELRTSTLSGEVSNLQLNKNGQPKKKLNPKKIEFIFDYVKKLFPNEVNIDVTIKQKIQQKCNNATPRPSRQNKLSSKG
ncbi:uncharacterized protein [Venturia canescens]|uniref:uncharacterized protein n=1 Tax=Venturia canescens TaxID=32260 RepID=UPI001C9BFDD3|nr:uncharacterized protein LOC122408177 [Venturia canescens]